MADMLGLEADIGEIVITMSCITGEHRLELRVAGVGYERVSIAKLTI